MLCLVALSNYTNRSPSLGLVDRHAGGELPLEKVWGSFCVCECANECRADFLAIDFRRPDYFQSHNFVKAPLVQEVIRHEGSTWLIS